MRPVVLIPLIGLGALLLAGFSGGLLGSGGYAKPKTPEPSSKLPTDPQEALRQLLGLYGNAQTDVTSKAPKSGRTYHVVLWQPKDSTKRILYINGIDSPTVYVATIDGTTIVPLVNIIRDATAQADLDQILHSL